MVPVDRASSTMLLPSYFRLCSFSALPSGDLTVLGFTDMGSDGSPVHSNNRGADGNAP